MRILPWLLAVASSGVLPAQDDGIHPMVGREAPAWPEMEWLRLPEGKEELRLADFEDRVLFLMCFQSRCGSCHRRGFPVLKELVARFEERKDVAFVAVQTAFEGFDHNTAEAARKTLEKYGLDIPLAHDVDPEGGRSPLMDAWHTFGTPWMVIVDRQGVARYAEHFIEVDEAARWIEQLAATEEDLSPLVGNALGPTKNLRWLRGGPAEEPTWTLYRWWTDGCPFCEASLPDLQRAVRPHREHLRLVAVYHRKRRDPWPDERILDWAEKVGYEGPVAADPRWRMLRDLMKRGRLQKATSVSFLVDPEGVIRWVHPGPRIHRSDDPDHAKADHDMRTLEKLLQHVVK